MSSRQDRQMLATLFRTTDVATFSDAVTAGIPPGLLRGAASRGDVIRVGKGAFAARDAWDAASDWERFRLRSLGFARCTHGTFLAGHAAALLHGTPVDGAPPGYPIAIRPGSPHLGSVKTPYGRTRHGPLPEHHQTRRAGVDVVSAAYTLVDVARHGTPLEGLMTADHLAHRGMHRDVPAAIAHRMDAYPGIKRVAWALEHADARCESPLETLGRYAFIAAGREVPLSNVWIYGPGRPRRVDHLLPGQGIVIEGDGGVKYNNRPDAAAIVDDEKERHRWLEQLGFGVTRYHHAMARHRPRDILAEVDRLVALHRGRPAPTCWSLDPPWKR